MYTGFFVMIFVFIAAGIGYFFSNKNERSLLFVLTFFIALILLYVTFENKITQDRLESDCPQYEQIEEPVFRRV